MKAKHVVMRLRETVCVFMCMCVVRVCVCVCVCVRAGRRK